MTAALERIATKPESLTEVVYASLREAIIDRRLRPGDRLTEAALARQLGVSKTPVREALLRLEYVGLIEVSPGRSVTVVKSSRSAIRSAYEVRAALEAQAARLAALRADRPEIVRIRAIAEACVSAAEQSDQAAFRSGDRTFHMALARASDNALLVRQVHDAFDLTWLLRRRDVPLPADSLTCARQHISIVDSVAASDPEGADQAMRDHVEKVQDLVLRSFDTSGGESASAST